MLYVSETFTTCFRGPRSLFLSPRSVFRASPHPVSQATCFGIVRNKVLGRSPEGTHQISLKTATDFRSCM